GLMLSFLVHDSGIIIIIACGKERPARIFYQAEDGIRDSSVTGVQTCALPIYPDTGAQVNTGTPIALLIENTDQRSKDYSEIKDKFRPGHADFTYEAKYGLRDYRAGGRSSARETATRVAAEIGRAHV